MLEKYETTWQVFLAQLLFHSDGRFHIGWTCWAFCDLLQEKGNGRFNQPEKIAKAIQRAITISYRLGALAQESINIVLSVLVRKIRALEKNIKELDKAIEQVVVVIPEYQCLTSIPWVGKVYAAGSIAEIGQIERFEN